MQIIRYIYVYIVKYIYYTFINHNYILIIISFYFVFLFLLEFNFSLWDKYKFGLDKLRIPIYIVDILHINYLQYYNLQNWKDMLKKFENSCIKN